MRKHNLQVKIKKLPDTPGVYRFLNVKGRIIYVGKARRLRRRVASYFRPGRVRDSRLELLVSEICDIRFIRASSEAEALIYEAGLIKDHKPKFNIELKDDKSYPFLKLTAQEEYPRLFVTRKRVSDGSMYYGPYVNVKLLKEAVSFMKRVFPLRTCGRFKKTVCLEYHIGQCTGPCEKVVTRKEYMNIVDQLKKFLEGKKDDLIHSLKDDMKRYSGKRQYEKAGVVKKRIEALTAVQQLHDRSQYPMYGELDELKNALALPVMPLTMECFDISNISAKQPVGAMVRFVGGTPRKSEYRKYRIKTVEGVDDYSMIREVVRRRYSRLVEEGKVLPDMILIDGGRGHLTAALGELKALGLGKILVASIAKENNFLYSSGRTKPIRLAPGSRLLALIQRVRDEAHRFAVTYHRRLRRAKTFDARLRYIKGIGAVRERMLIEKFGSIKRIQKADYKELIEAGMDKRTAMAVIQYFKTGR